MLYLQGKENRSWIPYDELALVFLNCYRWDIGLRLKKNQRKIKQSPIYHPPESTKYQIPHKDSSHQLNKWTIKLRTDVWKQPPSPDLLTLSRHYLGNGLYVSETACPPALLPVSYLPLHLPWRNPGAKQMTLMMNSLFPSQLRCSQNVEKPSCQPHVSLIQLEWNLGASPTLCFHILVTIKTVGDLWGEPPFSDGLLLNMRQFFLQEGSC